MTRILYLIAESWPTHRVDVTTLFGKELPKLGVRSDLVTTTSEDVPPPWGGGSVDLAVIKGGMARQYLGAFWHALTALLRTDWNAYDAIQVRDLPLPAALALTFCRWRRKRFVYWMSYPMSEGQIQLAAERGMDAGFVRFIFPWVRGRVGRFLLYRYVLPRADHIFVQSEFMKQDLVAKNIPPVKMTPVPMGVDTQRIAAGPVPEPRSEQFQGRRVLLYLGILDRSRRIEVLFEALALVREQHPNAVLLVVGATDDTSQQERLARRAKQAGMEDHIIWTGWVPIEEAWGYVALSEVGFSPFPRSALLDSSSPTKIVEYLALGLLTVCNDNPDQAAIMQATGAGRCVPYQANTFAQAVIELLEAPEQEKARLVDAGRAWVRANRDYRSIARTVAAAYAEICDSPQSLPASETS